MPDLTYAEGISGNDAVVDIDYIPAKKSTEYDKKVLAFCYEKPRKVSEIATFLNLSNSSYLREKILQNLKSQDYLIEINMGRTKFYKANREIVKG